jgi:hypothetical protein
MCLNATLDIIKFWETFLSILKLDHHHEPIQAIEVVIQQLYIYHN